jgi:tetratricopeptide (TPR) repeat protein
MLSKARRPLKLVVLVLSGLAWADQADQKEEPVGFVTSAGGSKLLRAGTETQLAARAGDLLFTGDGLKTGSASASFLFCPAKLLDTVGPLGEVRFESRRPKVRSGRISEQPVQSCFLPTILRVAVASQQHYGATMTRGTGQDWPPVPRDRLAADVRAELAPLDAALAANANDPVALLATAVVFEKYKLNANALHAYYKLLAQWPEAVWIQEKKFELENALALQDAAKAAEGPGGQTFALLIGISKYRKPEISLQFAHADANLFAKFIESPRGGGVPPGNILLLTDEKATTAAVRNGFHDFLKRRAKKTDTVIILIAGHGTVEVPGNKNAFILTHDSDPEDLTSTALPMAELQALFDEQAKRVGQVLLFVDVCKAAKVGAIHNTTVNSKVESLADAGGDNLLLWVASGPKESSYEDPTFGGGHGAFSYYVIKGLQGDADVNQDGAVVADELFEYVRSQVRQATHNQQTPHDFGSFDKSMKLSDTRKAGIDLALRRILLDWKSGRPFYLASTNPEAAPWPDEAPEDLDRFTTAIDAGRVLPDQPQNAFDALKKLKTEVTPERYFELENQLRIALENRAQDVVLHYLAGDQIQQTQQEFKQGAQYMEAARTLTPESLFLEGRQYFFNGRALLFEKKYANAAGLIEQSVRIDPGAAYAYNALGIAYLEQGDFEKAIPAFRDAVRRAHYWAYPRHNLALTYFQIGHYDDAIRSYQDAIHLAPQYSYLQYNLGLVFQRVNRRREAERAFLKAIELNPNLADPYNALGYLNAAYGHRREAERLYLEALSRDQNLFSARQNLAVLLSHEPSRFADAIALWHDNLAKKPDYLPSLLSLAKALATTDNTSEAINEYRKVVALKPDYTAARLALAELETKTGNIADAVAQLSAALALQRNDPDILERIGDVQKSGGNKAEAIAAYNSAVENTADRSARKRLQKKIAAMAKL